MGQKEKQQHEKAIGELESHQNDAKKIQQQLSKATRECTRLGNLVEEREGAQLALKDELRKAKMLQSRPVAIDSKRVVKPVVERPTVKAVRPPSVDSKEARGKVLEMLEANDPKKMDKIDAIMERFEGRESFLLMKMAARYNNTENVPAAQVKSAPVKASSANSLKNMNPAQKRSEMALARHMERMRNRKSERDLNN